jgi:hypothetical protein
VDDPEFAGMKDYDTTNIQMPCTDCFITGFLGSLELLDGTVANANTGMWLHHVVFININRTDTTCPKYPDRFMASGNERTPLDLTAGGYVEPRHLLQPIFPRSALFKARDSGTRC